MELLIEILVKGVGSLDINTKDMEDFGIPLTFNISDIKDFASRKASFSKTISVLGSRNNNRIFNHLYEIKGQDFTFKITERHNCVLLVNKAPVLDGYLVLRKIKKLLIGDQYQVVYNLNIYDETKNFFEGIKGKSLQDLDFSSGFTFKDEIYEQGNHQVDEAQLDTYMDQVYTDIFNYPIVNYGYFLDFGDKYPFEDNISLNLLYPAIYMKPILDRIFYETDDGSGTGYTYESNFLDGLSYSGMFKEIALLYNKSKEYVNLHVCEYVTNSGYTILSAPGVEERISIGKFDSVINGLHTIYYELDYFNYYSYLTTKGPRVSAEGDYTVTVRLDVQKDRGGQASSAGCAIVAAGYQSIYELWKYDAENAVGVLVKGWTTYDFRPGTYNGAVDFTFEEAITTDDTEGLNRGDFFYFVIKNGRETNTPAPACGQKYSYIILNGLSLELINNRELDEGLPGGVTGGTTPTIKINEALPEMAQDEFIKNLIKMFNLYIFTKDDPTKLYIEPRDDFYKAGEIINWTDKVDYSKNVEMISLNKLVANDIDFKHAEGKDFYSVQYRNNWLKNYGDKELSLDNPYLKEKKEIKIDFQSYMAWDSGLWKTPVLYEEAEHTYYDERMELEPMVCFIKHSGGFVRLGNYETGIIRNGYINDPSWALNANILGGYSFDLNFETDTGYTFSLPYYDPDRGLYKVFWEGYMNDLTNDASRMVTLYCDLDLKDILTLNFKNRILIDGQMYYLEKLEYDPSSHNSSKVILFKEIDPISEGSFDTFYLLKSAGNYILTDDTDKIIIN